MRAKRWVLACCLAMSCAEEEAETEEQAQIGGASEAIVYAKDVAPITRVEAAKPGVFIPPFRQCTSSRDGRPGLGPDGKVCANVAISGATEPGRWFADYASCDVVVRQRPYWPAPPAGKTAPDDARLKDASYLRELAWVTEQVAASGCVCCHDARAGRAPSQWDLRAEGVWLDSLSDDGLALFAGYADSSVLGAYAPEDNFGFARDVTGIPSNDPERMRRFMTQEVARRGISEARARAVPPFGGPLHQARVTPPSACKAGEGVDPSGTIRWNGGPARYVYVLAAGSQNPGVPPNLDLPRGTLFRLDVRASETPLASAIRYGTTPPGSVQVQPPDAPAPALKAGETYHLAVLRDVGLPIANCLFEFGSARAAPAVSPAQGSASATSSSACALPGGDARGFGAPCARDADCTCAANYCALSPGARTGYCSVTGCSAEASVCPSGYSCFDLSRFAAGLPAFCAK